MRRYNLETYIRKLSFFLSSYSPLFIIIFISNWNRFNIKWPLHIHHFCIFICLIFLFLLPNIVVFSIYIEAGNSSQNLGNSESISKIKDDKVINYLMAYVIPLSALNIDNFMESILPNIIIFIIIGIIYMRMDLIYLNPFLCLFGFIPHLDEENDKVYITDFSKEELVKLIRGGKSVNCTAIGDNIFLIRKDSNNN